MLFNNKNKIFTFKIFVMLNEFITYINHTSNTPIFFLAFDCIKLRHEFLRD
jgi:hypothetical protein